MSCPQFSGASRTPRIASLMPCSRSTLRRHFSTTRPSSGPSFLNLQARSMARESGHFSKQSGVPYVHHSPALQLLSAERDLAEGNASKKSGVLSASALALKSLGGSLNTRDGDVEDYKRYNDVLQGLLQSSRNEMDKRIADEQKEYRALDDRNIRTKFYFGLWMLLTGFLVADAYLLTDEVEQHCEGCYEGNTKSKLWVFGYVKAVTDSFRHSREPARAPRILDASTQQSNSRLSGNIALPITPAASFDTSRTNESIPLQMSEQPEEVGDGTIRVLPTTSKTDSWLSFLWAKPRSL